eukprot:SAG11_NODE_20_length_25330_cov_18.348143_10_plen_259_part_00
MDRKHLACSRYVLSPCERNRAITPAQQPLLGDRLVSRSWSRTSSRRTRSNASKNTKCVSPGSTADHRHRTILHPLALSSKQLKSWHTQEQLVPGATIAMVGDGVNDAAALSLVSRVGPHKDLPPQLLCPTLFEMNRPTEPCRSYDTQADVGVAMGAGGTAAAMESAHVALMDSSLLKLALARELGVTCLRKIRQNVIFALASKLIMLTLAIAGYAPLWLAILGARSTGPVVLARPCYYEVTILLSHPDHDCALVGLRS